MATIEARSIKNKDKNKPEDLYVQVRNEQIRVPQNITMSGLKAKLKAEKDEDILYQSRRWYQWEENYLLFRDTVEVNRLTQRQAVNVPLIKETVKTVMSKLQDEPELLFKDRGGDDDKEIVTVEFWRDDADRNRVDLLDSADKKQVLLYGRSHTKHNFKNGRWTYELKDIRDIVVDKKTKPHDIQSARHIEELNIWKPLADILVDDSYDQAARNALAAQAGMSVAGSQAGAQAHNRVLGRVDDATQRDERLTGIGVPNQLLNETAYETMVQMTQHYTQLWDESKKKFVRHVILTTGEDCQWILKAQTLVDAIGIDEWPIDTWADDLEATDYWSDGVADSIRTINQTINIWISQLIENRTFRNFGMNFYDSTASEGFTPAGYDPRPFGWYPLPGKPDDVYKSVEVPDLASITGDIQFLIGLAEKASATGAIDKGVVEQGKRTLGEIEIAVSKAMERTTAMAKYYKRARKDMGNKWYSINEANVTDTAKIKLYKMNIEGRLKGISIKRDQWVSEEGYEITVETLSESITERTDELIRLQAVKQMFPDNPPLDKAIQKRAVLIGKLTPEEKTDVMDYEDQKRKAAEEQRAAEERAQQEMMNPQQRPAPRARPGAPIEEAEQIIPEPTQPVEDGAAGAGAEMDAIKAELAAALGN